VSFSCAAIIPVIRRNENTNKNLFGDIIILNFLVLYRFIFFQPETGFKSPKNMPYFRFFMNILILKIKVINLN